MTRLRIVHFADAHLGVETYGRIDPTTGLNSRLLDFTRRLDEVIEYAIETRVDLVLFAGDAYRSRDPSPTQQREFARRIRRLSSADIPVFLLVGNHDLPAASGRANSLDIFDTLAVPNVTVGRTLDAHRIETASGPVQIVALPWLRRSALLANVDVRALNSEDIRRMIEERAAEFVETVAATLDPTVPAILAAHLSVEGATYGSERSVLVGEDIVLPRSAVARPEFVYVALGHIHKHQILGDAPPVVYPGSIERVDFGEERDDKGFVVVSIENGAASIEFKPLPARRFVTVHSHPTGDDPTSVVLRDLEQADVADAIVRVIVSATAEVDVKIDYAIVRRALREASCIAGIRRDIERSDRRPRIGTGVESLSMEDALDLYLRTRDVPEERRKTLLRYASGLDVGPA